MGPCGSDLVKDMKTVRQTLAALKKRYDGDQAAEFYTLHRKWEALAKEPNEDIHTYFARAVLLRDRLEELQQPITEQGLVAKLLGTLPMEYHLYVEMSKDRFYTPAGIKYHDFLLAMQHAEVSIGQQSNGKSTEKALKVSDDHTSGGYKGRGGRHRGRGRGEKTKRDTAHAGLEHPNKRGRGGRHVRGRGRDRTRQHAAKFDGHCHHCGRYGHMIKDCLYAQKQQQPQQQNRQEYRNNPNLPPHMNQQQRHGQDRHDRAQYAPASEYPSHNTPPTYEGDFAPMRGTTFQAPPARAYMAAEDVAHYSGVVDQHLITSVLDSGSTRHMTPIKAALYEYVAFNEPPVIYVGNGVPCKVLGKGNLYVRPNQHPQGDRDIKITDVWFVPDLIETLISLKQLTSKGAKGEFEEDTITVYDKTSSYQVTPCERRRTTYVYRMLAQHWVWNQVPRGLKVTMLSCFKGFWYKFLAGWAPVPSHDPVALRTREFHERICTKCGKREVADERHILLSCSVTREYIVRYRPRLRWSTSLPTFMFWNHQQEALVWFVVECIAAYMSHR